jgi:outer membrane protein TolC
MLHAIDVNHPLLKMYDLKAEAFDSYAQGAKSWEAPQAGTGFYMLPYSMENGMGAYMLTVQQMIPNPGKLRARDEYIKSMSSIETLYKDASVNELHYQAKAAYFKLLILQKKKTVMIESKELLSYIIQLSEIRYPYGDEKISSIYMAKARLNELENELVMIENNMDMSRIAINTLMNRDYNTAFDADTSFTLYNYENETADTVFLMAHRSDIKAMDQKISTTYLKQTVEWSKRKPDFGIRYDHMFTFGMNPNQFSVMGMITIPIAPWSSKMYRSEYQGLQLDILALEKERESMLVESRGMVVSVQTQIRYRKVQTDLYKKNIIPSLEKSYYATLLAYEQNTESLYMVIDAWLALKMEKTEYLDHLEELLLLQAEFEKLTEYDGAQ